VVHSRREVDRVRELLAAGVSVSEASRTTGIPRRTIGDWKASSFTSARERAQGCWKCQPLLAVPREPYARLLGVYLGDGSLVKHRNGVHRLVLVQDARYTRLIAEWKQLAACMFGRRVGCQHRPGCVAISSYSTHWPCLFPQHGPGKKHERSIRLESWQQAIVDEHPRAFLRGLIESDGSRHLNTVKVRGKHYAYSRYTFTNYSADIQRLFIDVCERLELRWTRTHPQRLAVSRRRDVAFMDTFIGPKS
jgi:hypothetical protein